MYIEERGRTWRTQRPGAVVPAVQAPCATWGERLVYEFAITTTSRQRGTSNDSHTRPLHDNKGNQDHFTEIKTTSRQRGKSNGASP